MSTEPMPGIEFVPVPWQKPAPHRLYDTGRPDISHVSTDSIANVAHIRNALIEQIAGASHKVMFCSFLFADDAIVQALCEAAERLRGGVYVITVLDKHLQAEVDEPDADNAAKMKERRQRHNNHLQRLAQSGAWLRSADDCHAKFSVVDDESAVVTSANATAEAYEANPEDGLVLRQPQIAREFGRLFSHIWQHLSRQESTPGARLNVQTLPKRIPPEWRTLKACGAIEPVTTLRSFEHSLQRAAIQVIDAAVNRLTIATYSFVGMESHPVGMALQKAVQREVEIDLLLRPRNHIQAQALTCGWLANLAPGRVRFWGHKRTHTKSIIADDAQALIWTGNLEAAHGWSNGIEVGLRIDDAGVASAIGRWSADVMRRATHTPSIGGTSLRA